MTTTSTYHIMKPTMDNPIPGYWVDLRTDYEDDSEHTTIAVELESSDQAKLAAEEHAGRRLVWELAAERALYKARV